MAILGDTEYELRARLTTDITVALCHVRSAESDLRSRVQLARDLGIEVDRIAEALGMSRATVYRRYLTDDVTDAYVSGRFAGDDPARSGG